MTHQESDFDIANSMFENKQVNSRHSMRAKPVYSTSSFGVSQIPPRGLSRDQLIRQSRENAMRQSQHSSSNISNKYVYPDEILQTKPAPPKPPAAKPKDVSPPPFALSKDNQTSSSMQSYIQSLQSRQKKFIKTMIAKEEEV